MKNKWVLILAALVAFSPLLFLGDASFLGADSLAEEEIQKRNPDYDPWADPLFEAPSGEVESLLFALQAALGAGFIGYFIGLTKGRKESSERNES
ncbi:energy-coupling factor ABC transporter substrate-binding protein [Calidifontibacillus erzurumensis]|uniref:Cobalt transport protein CbiN n=1 Tax=Calidifontibacillus erzurumensis TaxID=2741433 RepID=A0A8J8GBD5_9BACI|nr:energy-coupling factor ABC transporter substrate-binding protein [Calidifontibacillus erzurumensis]NSL50674.1 energy-coupling factor ABC transporter substrate-binding protein [Calidifontibacillus erzurumensis]